MKKDSKAKDDKSAANSNLKNAASKNKFSAKQAQNKKNAPEPPEDISDELKIHQAQTERD